MKIYVHDLAQEDWEKISSRVGECDVVVDKRGEIRTCAGCFGCWIKTPGICVLKDDYCRVSTLLSEAEELVLISRNVFGSYSPFVKTVLDRSIGYMLPYFRTYRGEMHHKPRYGRVINVRAVFYGEDQTDDEIKTAENLVQREAINLGAGNIRTEFVHTVEEVML